MTSAPTPMIRLSISAAPTRDHQPASWYWPEATGGVACAGPPSAPGGGGLV
jgi:hypothetical protein